MFVHQPTQFMQNNSASKLLLYTASTVRNRGVNTYDSHRLLEVHIQFVTDVFTTLW